MNEFLNLNVQNTYLVMVSGSLLIGANSLASSHSYLILVVSAQRSMDAAAQKNEVCGATSL